MGGIGGDVAGVLGHTRRPGERAGTCSTVGGAARGSPGMQLVNTTHLDMMAALVGDPGLEWSTGRERAADEEVSDLRP